MSLEIDIGNSTIRTLPILSDEEAKGFSNGKGWSFFNVYFLRELRDIFILKRKEGRLNAREFAFQVFDKINSVKSDWNERRVLEYVNALQNLELIDNEGRVTKDLFKNSIVNTPLSDLDRKEFRQLFFNYFRFREIMTWFIQPDQSFHDGNFRTLTQTMLIENSLPVFYFSRESRFVDSLFYELKENNPDIYQFPVEMDHLMRFWDVFIKWGTTLGQLERINLSFLDIKLVSGKEVSCCYFIKEEELKIDFVSFLQNAFNSRYIFIPDIILKLALRTRLSVEYLRNYVLLQIQKSNSSFTYERTSEIFIIQRRSEKKAQEVARFFPMHNNSYISHIILR